MVIDISDNKSAQPSNLVHCSMLYMDDGRFKVTGKHGPDFQDASHAQQRIMVVDQDGTSVPSMKIRKLPLHRRHHAVWARGMATGAKRMRPPPTQSGTLGRPCR